MDNIRETIITRSGTRYQIEEDGDIYRILCERSDGRGGETGLFGVVPESKTYYATSVVRNYSRGFKFFLTNGQVLKTSPVEDGALMV